MDQSVPVLIYAAVRYPSRVSLVLSVSCNLTIELFVLGESSSEEPESSSESKTWSNCCRKDIAMSSIA